MITSTAPRNDPAARVHEDVQQAIEDLLVRLLTLGGTWVEPADLGGDLQAALNRVGQRDEQESAEVIRKASCALTHLGSADLPAARKALVTAHHLVHEPSTVRGGAGKHRE